MRLLLVALLSSLAFACTAPPDSGSGASGVAASSSAVGSGTASACRKFGDRCEFAPGKLGTCVQKPDCDVVGDSCFVCQSQH